MKDQKYKNTILELSLILNELQKPIQILDSVKWQEGVDEFSLVTVGRSCQFGVEQVVVLTKKLAFLFVERNDGVLVQIQPRTPVACGCRQDEDTFGIFW